MLQLSLMNMCSVEKCRVYNGQSAPYMYLWHTFCSTPKLLPSIKMCDSKLLRKTIYSITYYRVIQKKMHKV